MESAFNTQFGHSLPICVASNYTQQKTKIKERINQNKNKIENPHVIKLLMNPMFVVVSLIQLVSLVFGRAKLHKYYLFVYDSKQSAINMNVGDNSDKCMRFNRSREKKMV